MPKVSIIVLNWNGRGYVEECVESLLGQSYRDFELVVVDNGSNDGSLELLREKLAGRALLLENNGNLGYAAGNNRGMREAGGEWIALVNNDVVADRLWLQELMKAVAEEEGRGRVGMAASKVLFYDERDVIDNTGHLMYPDGLNRGRGRLERDGGQYDSCREALFPSGAAGLYRRAMLEEIGLLDEDFFAYGEDADLGLRGRWFGWRCIFAPRAKVYHRYSASTGAYSALKVYHVERNRVWVMVKNFPLSMILVSPVYTLARYYYQSLQALAGKGAAGEFVRARSRLNLVIVLVKSLAEAIVGLGKMRVKRRNIMRKAKLSPSQMARVLNSHKVSPKQVGRV